jgi:hypothetical protein
LIEWIAPRLPLAMVYGRVSVAANLAEGARPIKVAIPGLA